MLITRAYRTELDPTPEQRLMMEQFAEAARIVFNLALSEADMQYTIWKHSRSAEAAPKRLNYMSQGAVLRRDILNNPEMVDLPDVAVLRSAPSVTINAALQNLDRAFAHFFRRVKSGEIPGFPRYKRYGFRRGWKFLSTVTATEQEVRLPKIGLVRLKERGYIPVGTAYKIRSAAVTEHEGTGRWYIAIAVEEEIPDPKPGNGTLAVHLGLRRLATVYDGRKIEIVENPGHLAESLDRLRSMQHDLQRARNFLSGRWGKKMTKRDRRYYLKFGKKAKRRAWQTITTLKPAIAVLHKHIADTRRDTIHKLTTSLVVDSGLRRIVVEDWDVKNMMQEGYYARGIADAAWGEINRQIAYKSEWSGTERVELPRDFQSSKRCSACGYIHTEFGRSFVFVCPVCKHREDRDDNAVKNCWWYADSHTASQQSSAEESVDGSSSDDSSLEQSTDDSGNAGAYGVVTPERASDLENSLQAA